MSVPDLIPDHSVLLLMQHLVKSPVIHVGEVDGIPGSWRQPGLVSAVVGNWGAKPVDGRSLSISAFLISKIK